MPVSRTNPTPPHEITQRLVAWSGGSQAALDKLYPLVYEELRRMAHSFMRHERKGHTLQTNALINEAYLRLVDQKNVHWANRPHFFGISSQIERRILVDHARRYAREKHGGGAQKVMLLRRNSCTTATESAPLNQCSSICSCATRPIDENNKRTLGHCRLPTARINQSQSAIAMGNQPRHRTTATW